MTDCLIGHTGFVGSVLDASGTFGERRNSRDFREMEGRSYGTVTCCGVSAVKWMANRDPERDIAGIRALLDVLRTIRAERFVLVSTVDVFSEEALRAGDTFEDMPTAGDGHHSYGRHRLWLEDRIRELFPVHHVVRLPALFGAGLKKNALFDMHHGRMLDVVDPDAAFSWYDLARLGPDLAAIEEHELRTVHLGTPVLRTGEIRDLLFPGLAIGASLPQGRRPPLYDLRTRFGAVFGGDESYISTRSDVTARLEAWSRRPDAVGPDPDREVSP